MEKPEMLFNINKSDHIHPLNNSIQKALQEYYLAKENLNVPILTENRVFHIKNSYVNLALIKNKIGSTTIDNLVQQDKAESSLATEEQFYADKIPLPLPTLFIPTSTESQAPICRILVTGRAGIGKSTLCHYISYQWANPEVKLFPQFDYVFWISLKTLENYENESNFGIAMWIYNECFNERLKHHYKITEQTIKDLIFDKQMQESCLLLLDGFDEVNHYYNNPNTKLGKILKETLDYPNVIVTSRPYHITHQFSFDRTLENVGFTDINIKQYGTLFFKELTKTNELQKVINCNPILQRICRIPLNLFLLCDLYDQEVIRDDNKNIDQTQLYQKFYLEFLVRSIQRKTSKKISSEDKGNVRSWTPSKVEELFKDEIKALEKIAFENFCTNSSPQLLIAFDKLQKICEEYNIGDVELLLETGFLRYIGGKQESSGSQNYYFVHLTFQEFFAAKYLLRCLLPENRNKAEFEMAIKFISERKYHLSYEVVMSFLLRLASEKVVPDKSVEYIWDAILTTDRDWIGLRHIELIIKLLEQAFYDNRVPYREKLLEEIFVWVLASIGESEEEFKNTIQRHLSDVLLMCPKVFKECFNKLEGKWSSLSNFSHMLALKYYLVPFVNMFDQVAEFLINTLEKNQSSNQQFQEILCETIPWKKIIDSPIKDRVIKFLLQLLDSKNIKIINHTIFNLGNLQLNSADIILVLENKLSHHNPLVTMNTEIALEKVLNKRISINLIDRITGHLDNGNKEFRFELVKVLEGLSQIERYKNKSIELLLKLLDDNDELISNYALKILENLGQENIHTNHEMWSKLQKKNHKVTFNYFKNYENLDGITKTRIEALQIALDDKEEYVKVAAANSLIHLYILDDKILNILLKNILNHDSKISKYSFNCLLELFRKYDGLLNDLFKKINDSLFDVSLLDVPFGAAVALCMLNQNDNRVINILQVGLKRGFFMVKLICAEWLIKLQKVDNSLIDLLVNEVNGYDLTRRIKALKLLISLEESITNTREILLKCLNDKDAEIRQICAEALIKRDKNNNDIIRVLHSNLDDYSQNLNAAISLIRLDISSDKANIVILKSLKGFGIERRLNAAEALIKLDKYRDEVISVLIDGIDSKVSTYISKSAELLGNLGAKEDKIINALSKILKHKDETVKSDVVNALIKLNKLCEAFLLAMGDAPLIDYQNLEKQLINYAKENFHVVQILLDNVMGKGLGFQKIAMSILGNLGNNDAFIIEVLRNNLNDNNKYMGFIAADVLMKLNCINDAVVNIFIENLSSDSSQVRQDALNRLIALKKIDKHVISTLFLNLQNKDIAIKISSAKALILLGYDDDMIYSELNGILHNKNNWYLYEVAKILIKCGKYNDQLVTISNNILNSYNGSYDEIPCIYAAKTLIKLKQVNGNIITQLNRLIETHRHATWIGYQPLDRRMNVHFAAMTLLKINNIDDIILNNLIDALIYNLAEPRYIQASKDALISLAKVHQELIKKKILYELKNNSKKSNYQLNLLSMMVKLGEIDNNSIDIIVKIIGSDISDFDEINTELLGKIEISYLALLYIVNLLKTHSDKNIRTVIVFILSRAIVKSSNVLKLTPEFISSTAMYLRSNDPSKVIKVINELLILKHNNAKDLLDFLLLQLDKKPSLNIEILLIINVLRFTSYELFLGYNKIFNNSDFSRHIHNILLQPLIECCLREGISLVDVDGGFQVSGKLIQNFNNEIYKKFVEKLIFLINQKLFHLELPSENYNTMFKADKPHYLQRCSLSFFKNYRLKLFGIIPLLTYNLAISNKKTYSVYPYLMGIFSTIKISNDAPYNFDVNEEQKAIKIVLNIHYLNNKASKYNILHSILEKHINENNAKYLDLSENQLDDKSMIIISDFLRKYTKLQVLRLSHNKITIEGLKILIFTLVKSPSLKYLLLDYNYIDFNISFCDELIGGLYDSSGNTIKSLLDSCGLVHLDLSINYIRQGKLLHDDVIVRKNELQYHITDHEQFYCRNKINKSFIVHSQSVVEFSSDYKPCYSLVDLEKSEDANKIFSDKSAVALLAYKTKLPPFGEHAFLVIERIIPDFGQRELILADLIVNNNNQIKIRIFRTSPENFMIKTKNMENVHHRIAFVTNQQLERLVDKIFISRDVSDFYDYALLPGNREGILNCMKWAAEMLQEISIIKDWKTWVPSMAVAHEQGCMLS